MPVNLHIKTHYQFGPKPSNTSVAEVAQKASIVFAGWNTQDDNNFWDALIDAGFDPKRIMHYGKMDNGDDPDAVYRSGSPSSTAPQPKRNNIGWEQPGDMQNIKNKVFAPDSDQWPLFYLNTDSARGHVAGEAVTSQSTYVNPFIHMDMDITSLQDHYIARFLERYLSRPAARRVGGVWWDNGNDHPVFVSTTIVLTTKYPQTDGRAWFNGIKRWVNRFIDDVCIPYGVKLCINVQSTGTSIARWKELARTLARYPGNRLWVEFFSMKSGGELFGTVNELKRNLEKLVYASALGLNVDCCVQLDGDLVHREVDATVNAKAKFALACYLLGMANDSTLRYSEDRAPSGNGYNYFSVPPIMTRYASLGHPTEGMRWVSNTVAERPFVGGGLVRIDYTTPSSPIVDIIPGNATQNVPLLTAQIDRAYIVGDTIEIPIRAEGNSLTYSLTSTPALPNGVTINAQTGVISGVPTLDGWTKVRHMVTATATDSGGNAASTTFALDIYPGKRIRGISINDSSIPTLDEDIFADRPWDTDTSGSPAAGFTSPGTGHGTTGGGTAPALNNTVPQSSRHPTLFQSMRFNNNTTVQLGYTTSLANYPQFTGRGPVLVLAHFYEADTGDNRLVDIWSQDVKVRTAYRASVAANAPLTTPQPLLGTTEQFIVTPTGANRDVKIGITKNSGSSSSARISAIEIIEMQHALVMPKATMRMVMQPPTLTVQGATNVNLTMPAATMPMVMAAPTLTPGTNHQLTVSNTASMPMVMTAPTLAVQPSHVLTMPRASMPMVMAAPALDVSWVFPMPSTVMPMVMRAPTLTVDAGSGAILPTVEASAINVSSGGQLVVTSNMLLATHDTYPVQFRINTLPTNGTLRLNNAPARVLDVFTPADIAAGRVTYTHNSGTSDTFRVTAFTVEGGIGINVSISVIENAGWILILQPKNRAPVIGGVFTDEGKALAAQRVWERTHIGLAERVPLPQGFSLASIVETDDNNTVDRAQEDAGGRYDLQAAEKMALRVTRFIQSNPGIAALIREHGPELTEEHITDRAMLIAWQGMVSSMDITPRRMVYESVSDWLGALSIVQRNLLDQ
jgi:hypothetical protein